MKYRIYFGFGFLHFSLPLQTFGECNQGLFDHAVGWGGGVVCSSITLGQVMFGYVRYWPIRVYNTTRMITSIKAKH